MKQYLKQHPIIFAILFGVLMLAVMIVVSAFQGQQYYYRLFHEGEKISEIQIQQFTDSGEPMQLVRLSNVEYSDAYTLVYFKVVAPGSGKLSISYVLQDAAGKTREMIQTVKLVVSKARIVYIGEGIFNHNGTSVTYWGNSIYALFMMLYFIWRRKSLGPAYRYSYTYISTWTGQIFFTFVFLCYAVVSAISIIWLRSMDELLLAGVTRYLMMFMTALTFPLVILFAISMTISNISLIRHEGKRFNNMLGILSGGILLLMVAAAIVLSLLFVTYGQDHVVIAVLHSGYNALYIVFISALGGAIISGLLAGYRKPSMGQDYIIILGCALRKDGTLYPLIRGRVDRAIAFWKEQEQQTGKRAVFVPSGGQGKDEIIAEGEAMKRYLLAQGIPEECILPETKSTTTYENMKFSKALINAANPSARIAFSTTNYHVMRSGILASQAGLTAEGMGARTKWYFWPNALLREVVGMFAVQPKLQIMTMAILALVAGAAGYVYYLIM